MFGVSDTLLVSIGEVLQSEAMLSQLSLAFVSFLFLLRYNRVYKFCVRIPSLT